MEETKKLRQNQSSLYPADLNGGSPLPGRRVDLSAMASRHTNSGFISPRTALLGYGACAIAGCLWGTGFYLGRLALNEMSVEHMVLYRFLFACVGMLPVALLNRVRFTGREIRILLISAAFGIPIQFLIQFHGLALTTVSHASLMVGSMPVLLAVAAVLFAGERVDLVGWAGLAGSTIGAA